MSKEIKTEAKHSPEKWSALKDGLKSINDLREKEYSGEKLSNKERQALIAFDKYRIAILNRQESEDDFHKKYLEFQTMANLTPYEEFLKETYLVL